MIPGTLSPPRPVQGDDKAEKTQLKNDKQSIASICHYIQWTYNMLKHTVHPKVKVFP